MPEAGKLRSFFLHGPAGRLEALLNPGSPDATHTALVCHPHPLYGGTMHNKVVYHAMKALSGFGFPVLRFNFRGAGLSLGEHDEGRGEVEDVRAALDWLASEFALPIVFCGFSFGAAVGLRAACPYDRVAALIALGMPITGEGRTYSLEHLHTCSKPKLFVSGSRDQYAARPELERAVAAIAGPKRLVIVDEAEHFFEGHLHEMRAAIEQWIPQAIGR